jgi:hypothetical protein
LEAVGASELLTEPLNAAGGIDKFLFAGEEGMTLIADIDVDLGHCAAGYEGVAAGAVSRTRLIPRMNFSFHVDAPEIREPGTVATVLAEFKRF